MDAKIPKGGAENNQAIREICEKGHFDHVYAKPFLWKNAKKCDRVFFVGKEN